MAAEKQTAKITKLDDGGLEYQCTCGRTVVMYRDKGDTSPITRVSRCFACAEKFTDGDLELLRSE